MITEQKRQALIAFNQAIIEQHEAYAVPESRWPDDVRMLVDSARIALASLQAEPDHYIFKHPAGELLDSLVSETSKGCDGVIAGYIAPPVQVIDISKLPELERWRSPKEVLAQAAYRKLTINMLEKGE